MGLKVSVIDLGFNSIKLVNYYVKHDNSYKAYEQEGIRVRLGQGLNEKGDLGREPVQRTIDSLKLFQDMINLQYIKQVLPFATSAVREAANKDLFLKEVYQNTGLRFRVLSVKEEALYSYLGALKSTCIPTALFFDLGGGSLEMVYTEIFKIKKYISLPLGALRLSQTYGGRGEVFTKKSYSKMKQYIIKALPDREKLHMSPDTTLVGVGGTLRAIARYDQEIRKYILDKVHNYKIDYESIDSINRRLYKMKLDEIAKIEAIGNDRAETITAGSCVISMLMQKLEFDRVVVSAQGLREGILSAFLESSKGYHQENINKDKIQRSVKHACKPDTIPRYIYALLELLISIGSVKKREYEILAQAIKQVSKMPPTTNMHNLFYMIIDEYNAHLSHREQLILALSIIYSRKAKAAKRLFTRYESILQPQNIKSIEKISACLTLSEILERSKSKVRFVTQEGKKIVISIMKGKKKPFPTVLMENTLKKFERALDISIDYSVSLSSGRPATAKPRVFRI